MEQVIYNTDLAVAHLFAIFASLRLHREHPHRSGSYKSRERRPDEASNESIRILGHANSYGRISTSTVRKPMSRDTITAI